MTTLRTLAACAALFFININTVAGQDDVQALIEEIEAYVIQETLFEMGFTSVGMPDGKLGPKSQQAIASWQAIRGYDATGHLTDEELDHLLSEPLPTHYTWAAMSVSTDLAVGAVWGLSSGIDAFETAKEECRAESAYPDQCTTLAVWSTDDIPNWVAAVSCARTGPDHFIIVAKATREGAIEMAFEREEQQGFARSDCNLLGVLSADGSHVRP